MQPRPSSIKHPATPLLAAAALARVSLFDLICPSGPPESLAHQARPSRPAPPRPAYSARTGARPASFRRARVAPEPRLRLPPRPAGGPCFVRPRWPGAATVNAKTQEAIEVPTIFGHRPRWPGAGPAEGGIRARRRRAVTQALSRGGHGRPERRGHGAAGRDRDRAGGCGGNEEGLEAVKVAEEPLQRTMVRRFFSTTRRFSARDTFQRRRDTIATRHHRQEPLRSARRGAPAPPVAAPKAFMLSNL